MLAGPDLLLVEDSLIIALDAEDIAGRLMDLGVPFIFATGYGEQAQIPSDHRGRTIVQKPYTLENVARAMDELLGSHQGVG